MRTHATSHFVVSRDDSRRCDWLSEIIRWLMPLLSLVSRLSNATPDFGDLFFSSCSVVGMNFALDEKATKGLYAEVKEGNRTYFECSICFRKLSRLQRIESHLKRQHAPLGTSYVIG